MAGFKRRPDDALDTDEDEEEHASTTHAQTDLPDLPVGPFLPRSAAGARGLSEAVLAPVLSHRAATTDPVESFLPTAVRRKHKKQMEVYQQVRSRGSRKGLGHTHPAITLLRRGVQAMRGMRSSLVPKTVPSPPVIALTLDQVRGCGGSCA
jgi:hypothetical protein